MRLAVYFVAVAFIIAAFPVMFLDVLALLPASVTHVRNDQGTYDRRGWLRASEPLVIAGMKERAFLSRTVGLK